MISKEKLIGMLELQNTLNLAVNPQWLKAGYPWHRAIMVETVEALDHYGWKWWKQQTPDLAQVRLELVDIWHFILSMALDNAGGDKERAAQAMSGLFYTPEEVSDKNTLILFDLLAGYAAEGKICVPAFVHLMKELDLSWNELYRLYALKNVLNVFRQDNGYKTGTYRKIWNGMEDNLWLEKIAEEYPEATPAQLYGMLVVHYDISKPAADAA